MSLRVSSLRFRVLPHLAPRADGAPLTTAPWRVLTCAEAVELRDPDPRALKELAAGTPVVLVSDLPLSRRRLRRTARRAGVEIDRELLVLPTTGSPRVLVDDDEASVRYLWGAVAMVPPGVARAAAPAALALAVARRLPWSWTGALAPGRVVLGRRS